MNLYTENQNKIRFIFVILQIFLTVHRNILSGVKTPDTTKNIVKDQDNILNAQNLRLEERNRDSVVGKG